MLTAPRLVATKMSGRSSSSSAGSRTESAPISYAPRTRENHPYVFAFPRLRHDVDLTGVGFRPGLVSLVRSAAERRQELAAAGPDSARCRGVGAARVAVAHCRTIRGMLALGPWLSALRRCAVAQRDLAARVLGGVGRAGNPARRCGSTLRAQSGAARSLDSRSAWIVLSSHLIFACSTADRLEVTACAVRRTTCMGP